MSPPAHPPIGLPEAEPLGQGMEVIAPAPGDADYCLIRGALPAGRRIPLHSHAERETVLVLGGHISAWIDGGWHHAGAGQVVEIPPDAKHAIQNPTAADATLLLVTTGRMAQFFRDIRGPLRPMEAAPDAAATDLFLKTVAAYGFWTASPEENARIGTP